MSFFEGLYSVFMRRTTVYAAFVLGGALAGERVCSGRGRFWLGREEREKKKREREG